jgi:hypothetical protein
MKIGGHETHRHQPVERRGCAHRRMRGWLHALDGAEPRLPCCNVFRLRDGLVADYRVYMDISPV